MKKSSVWGTETLQKRPQPATALTEATPKKQQPVTALLVTLAFMSLFLVPACGVFTDSTTTVAPDSGGPAMVLATGLYERGHSLPSLAIRGGASYTNLGKRHYFKFEALVLKPGYLLFTAFDPAGRPAFKLASDGMTLTGILYGHKQYAVGAATAENFGRFIPLGLTPEQLVALMSGAQVLPAAAGAVSTGTHTELSILPSIRPEGDHLKWRVRLAGTVNQDPALAVVETADYGPPLSPSITIKYRAIKEVNREERPGLMEPFPHSVEIEWIEKDPKMLRVTYDEVRLGLPLDRNLFNLTQPEGFELIQLH